MDDERRREFIERAAIEVFANLAITSSESNHNAAAGWSFRAAIALADARDHFLPESCDTKEVSK